MTIEFDHVAIKSTDIARSVEWYMETFKNTKLVYQDNTWALINVGNASIAFVMPDQHKPHICFQLKGEHKKSYYSKYDFKMHRDKTKYCYIDDPDGNTIEFLVRDNDD